MEARRRPSTLFVIVGLVAASWLLSSFASSAFINGAILHGSLPARMPMHSVCEESDKTNSEGAFSSDVAYPADGTPMESVGNAINQPETKEPDLDTPGSALHVSLAYLAMLCLHKMDDRGAAVIAEKVANEAPAGDITVALKVFNTFSELNRLGMHLGDEKGRLITAAVRSGMPESGPAVILETGCHAGDGSLFAALAVGDRPGSKIISTEADPNWLAAAKKVVAHATSTNKGFTHLPMKLAEDADFGSFLDQLRMTHEVAQLHAVILDQDHARFADQVKLMIEKKMLRKGATVYVDNMGTKRELLQPFIQMVQNSNNWVTTRIDIQQPYEDVVSISTYMGESHEL